MGKSTFFLDIPAENRYNYYVIESTVFCSKKTAGREIRMKYNRSVWQSLTMISQFGINMLVPVLACSFLGIFLDKKFETSYLVIILFFVGAAAGGRNCYRFAKRIFDKPSGSEAYIHPRKNAPK